MHFFATRRIVEGLGLGLARRAARKLVPVVLTLGSGPSGFPRKLSGRRPKLPRQLAPVILTLGAGPSGFSKQLSERRPKLPRQPWQTRAVARARSVILALGAGPSGFPKQFSGRRPKLLRQPPSRSLPSFWRWGLARRETRNKFPSDVKRGDLGRRQPWQTRAVARARSVISALGAGPSGFPKQPSGQSFRDSHGKPAPSLAHAPLFWRWGLARRASRNKFPSDQSGGILEAAAAYAARSLYRNTGGPDYQGRGPGQWPQWPFYQPEADKWPDL